MQDIKMTKNKLPKEWEYVKVSSIAELIRGINYKKDIASSSPFQNSLPLLRANNINVNLNFEDLVYVPKSLVKSEQIVKKDDIIFAMSSGSKHLVGKTAVAKEDFEGSYGAFCALLRIKEGINKKYVSYIFKGNTYRKLISEIAKGTSINNLKREHILDFEFPLPPLEIQHTIVSKIEELFSELDQGIADLKTAQAQLKVYRQSVLKHAFEGDWKVFNIKDVTIDIFAGGDKPKEYSEFKNEKFPFPIYANAVAKKGLFGFTNLARVKEECITIAGRGSGTGHIELRTEPFLPIVRLIVIIPNKKIITSKYLYYYLKNLTIVIEGSAIPQLTIPTVKEYFISVPPLEEQHLIVQEIESRLSVADKMEESIQESLQKAEALRQSILKKAFSGELV